MTHERLKSARRAGSSAIALTMALSLAIAPTTAALAQGQANAATPTELAQINGLTATVVGLINALPGATSQEVFEAQIAAAIEATGLTVDLTRASLLKVLDVQGLPAAAVAAVRSLLAKGVGKRVQSTAALGGASGPGFPDSLGGGGGGSDY